MDAFDADVLIYAAVPGHPLGRRVAALFPEDAPDPDGPPFGIGSVLLLPELPSKPLREGAATQTLALNLFLARLDLRAVDAATARLAVSLAATYRLKAADAIHLATAVSAGADRFLTNNRRDFPPTISEIDITYPDTIPD